MVRIVLAATVVAVAGCGSVPSHPRPGVTSPPAAPPPPGLATSMGTAGGTWAIAVLGGSAAADNNFWQLFVRPAGQTAWRLVTPPGVASNGGLVAAPLGGQSLIAGFRPSQDLAFSPLASTGDDGSSWSAGVLDAELANVPDALAATSGGGRLLALLSSGAIEQSGRGAASWSRLASLRSLAASPAGRRCSLTGLTAVAFTPSGTPLAAGTCAHPGSSVIFSYTSATSSAGGAGAGTGGWRAAGPALPSTLAGWPVRVLRLTSTAAGEVALLAVGPAGSTQLLAGWSADGVHWTLSAPLTLTAGSASADGAGGAAGTVRAAGFSAAGAVWVLLPSGQADMIGAPGTGAAWRTLPVLPAHIALLAFASSGGQAGAAAGKAAGTASGGTGGSGAAGEAGLEALATFGSKLTVWSLASNSAWVRAQAINVPIQYGSSS